jgi:hypothetical protein
MRCSYVLAMAVISVYCLTDAFASSPGEPAGKRVFTAEIVDAPMATVQANDAAPVMQASAAAVSPEGVSPAAEPVEETAKLAVRPAAPAATSAPKTRVAAVPPRRPAPAKAEPVAPNFAAAPSHTEPAPARQPAVQPVAVAQRSTASNGCSGARWSQPDAAGVPVLLCN